MISDKMVSEGWIEYSGQGEPGAARGNLVMCLLKSGRETSWVRPSGVTWNTSTSCDEVVAFKINRVKDMLPPIPPEIQELTVKQRAEITDTPVEALGTSNEFESAALRSARSLQMEHADVNLKRSEDNYRKERAVKLCMNCKIELDAVTASDLCLLCLDTATNQREPEMAGLATKSDGSTASYYELPKGVEQLQDLISHKDMNAQIGEIFRACYRYGQVEHSERMRDAKKVKFYAEAEIARLEKL